MIKYLLLLVGPFFWAGCATTDSHQEAAHNVARVVEEQAGYIEDGVAILVRGAIALTKEGLDKDKIILLCHIASTNLNGCISRGEVSPEAIRQALDMDEPFYDKLFQTIAKLISDHINKLRIDGYADAGLSILTAASKGISDGTAR